MCRRLKDLIELVGIDKSRATALPSGGESLDHTFDVSPEDFLEQAERDYESGAFIALGMTQGELRSPQNFAS